MDSSIDLNSQLEILDTYIKKNSIMVVKKICNTELSYLYLNMNNVNFKLRAKILELIQQLDLQNRNNNIQSLNVSNGRQWQLNCSNPVILNTSKHGEQSSIQANLDYRQSNDVPYVNNTVHIPCISSAFLSVQSIKKEDKITEKYYNIQQNKLHRMEVKDNASFHIETDNNGSLYIKTEDISVNHMGYYSMHDSSQAYQTLHNISKNFNAEFKHNDCTILEDNIKNKLQKKINTSDSSFYNLNSTSNISMLYCYRRLYITKGTKESFAKQDIFNEFKYGSNRLKGLDDKKINVLIEKMCSKTNIIRITDDGYKFVSEKAYNDNVRDKLLEYKELQKNIKKKKEKKVRFVYQRRIY